jgi:signal peptidase I
VPDKRTALPPADDRAASALAAFLLQSPDGFYGAGRQLAKANHSVDIPIRGGSMGASLPEGTLIRVSLGDGAAWRAGDIVVFRQHGQIVVHRAVARTRRYLITRGDARIAPDAPVAPDCIVGKVTGIVGSADVREPPASPRRHWLVRLAHFFAFATTVFAVNLSPGLAGRWVAFLTWIERHVPPARGHRGAAVI